MSEHVTPEDGIARLTDAEQEELETLLEAVLLPGFSVRERQIASAVAKTAFQARQAEVSRLAAALDVEHERAESLAVDNNVLSIRANELWAERERLAAALAEQEQKADRLATQAGDISGWLLEAGCPAMSIPEGVKWLLHRAEHAEASLAAQAQELNDLKAENRDMRNQLTSDNEAFVRLHADLAAVRQERDAMVKAVDAADLLMAKYLAATLPVEAWQAWRREHRSALCNPPVHSSADPVDGAGRPLRPVDGEISEATFSADPEAQ